MDEKFLLPLAEYATEPEKKNTCIWPLERGLRIGEPCGWNCTYASNEYCSAHLLCAQRREGNEPKTPSNTPEKKVKEIHNSEYKSEVFAESYDDFLSNREIQENTEKIMRLNLLNNMINLLKISFK